MAFKGGVFFYSDYFELIRFNKPAGTILLFIPCFIGLQASENVSFVNVFIFFIGSFLLRSSGCIINDIVDRKIDKLIERTKNRPIASGKISVFQALILLFIFLLLGFLLLLLLPAKAITTALLFFPIVILYPFCKRFFFMPQLILGIVFNCGALISQQLEKMEIFLTPYFACILWTLIYDTIYALQDIEDDKKHGVKSSAIFFGRNIDEILIILSILSSVLFYVKMGFLFSALFFLANILSIFIAKKRPSQAFLFNTYAVSVLTICKIFL